MFPDPITRDTPDVLRVLYQYRIALEARETTLLNDMANRWLMIEQRLDADIASLAMDIQLLKDRGIVITENVVLQSQKYQLLRSQMEREIIKYNTDYASGAIAKAQFEYATLGIDKAQNALMVTLGNTFANFQRINISAVEAMIGFAGDGSPLNKLLRADYQDAVYGLTNALINGIARGQGPVQTAQQMSAGMGMGFERAVLIARTETLRAYRTATTAQYRESGAVSGYRRLVFKPTACMACLMADGEYFELENELTDHPRGKCDLIATIKGVNDIKWETGKEWFGNLSPEEQSEKMGPEKYALWKDGQFKLDDLYKVQKSSVWGDSPRVATLKELTNQ